MPERRRARECRERFAVPVEFMKNQALVRPHFRELRVEREYLIVKAGRLGEVPPLLGLPGAVE